MNIRARDEAAAGARHQRLLGEPRWFLNNIDLAGRKLEFLKVNEQALRQASFLDRRGLDLTQARESADLDTLVAALFDTAGEGEFSRVNYMLHTAFCCSTLITRCLDVHGVNLSLREPYVLMTLANDRRKGSAMPLPPQRWRQALTLATSLLGRAFVPNEKILIKPMNSANNLLADLLRLPNTGKVILLYSSLERFLVSIIRGGEQRRVFIRRLYSLIAPDTLHGLSQRKFRELSDLQVGALVWHVHLEHFQRIISAAPRGTMRTLDCDVFLSLPKETLSKLFTFYELNIDAEQIETIIAGPTLSRYSKDDARSYDARSRETDYQETRNRYAQTLRLITTWARNLQPLIELPLAQAL